VNLGLAPRGSSTPAHDSGWAGLCVPAAVGFTEQGGCTTIAAFLLSAPAGCGGRSAGTPWSRAGAEAKQAWSESQRACACRHGKQGERLHGAEGLALRGAWTRRSVVAIR